MAKDIDLDKIIRSNSTPEEAMRQVNTLTEGKLTDSERMSISQRILNSSKFKGRGGGGGISGGGGTSGGGESSFFKGAETLMAGLNSTVQFTSDRAKEAYKSQMGKSNYNTDDSSIKILSAIGKGGLTGSLPNIINTMYDEIIDQLTEESKLHSEINTKTGISGELSKELQYDMKAASIEAKKYGFELSDIGNFYTTLSEQSGKFSLINKSTIEDASKTAAALGMTMEQLAGSIGEYEKVGIGAKETMKTIGDSAVRSISLGLNARKVADGMKESIGKLNEYGFKNGVEGLERMVRKSIEFKISMDSVAKIADAVMNPEGAIDLAANLQVLGGAIGSFGDPIKMMYEATNNMEGLQDSLIGAASGLATYNQEQKRFEITGINLRRAKEMARALNVDYKELASGAIAAQERMAASTALMSTGLQMEEKDREFLTNLGRMQDGEMKIVVPESLQDKLGKQSAITLSELTEDQKKVLLANREAFKTMDTKQIAEKQLTETQLMGRNMDSIAAYVKIRAASMLRGSAAAVLGSKMKDLENSLLGVDKNTNLKKDEEDANKKLKNLNLGSVRSAVQEGINVGKERLQEVIRPNNLAQTQQPVAQEVRHTVNITSNPAADVFAEGARKNAAVAFSMTNKNSRGYDVLTPASRKGRA